MKLIKANHNKPHRCNLCHGVADVFYEDDAPRGWRCWLHFYHCERGCDVWWHYGYTDYMAWTWWHGPIKRIKGRTWGRWSDKEAYY
jgi:hypothetical protein